MENFESFYFAGFFCAGTSVELGLLKTSVKISTYQILMLQCMVFWRVQEVVST